MEKISDYSKLRERSISRLENKREGKIRIKVVLGICSMSVGANQVLKVVQDTIKEENIENVIVEITGCIGLCHAEPILIILDADGKETVYDLVTEEKAQIITLVHGRYGKPVLPWVIKNR